MIALDTNLLVYAHRAAVAQHQPARRAITRASRSPGGWGFSLPVAVEFWSVVTHPTASGRPSTPNEAARFLAGLETAGAVGAVVERVARSTWRRRIESLGGA